MTELEQWDATLDVKGTGGPAFTVRVTDNIVYTGMTIRDYFAANALQVTCEDYMPTEAAKLAYDYADAMLKERLK
jgi:hypothetical protein